MLIHRAGTFWCGTKMTSTQDRKLHIQFQFRFSKKSFHLFPEVFRHRIIHYEKLLLLVLFFCFFFLLFRKNGAAWLGVKCDGRATNRPGFNSRWYPYESLVAAGRASGQNFSHAPLKVLPWYACPSSLTTESTALNSDVLFRKNLYFTYKSRREFSRTTLEHT